MLYNGKYRHAAFLNPALFERSGNSLLLSDTLSIDCLIVLYSWITIRHNLSLKKINRLAARACLMSLCVINITAFCLSPFYLKKLSINALKEYKQMIKLLFARDLPCKIEISSILFFSWDNSVLYM